MGKTPPAKIFKKTVVLPGCRGWLGLVIGCSCWAGRVVHLPRVPDGRAGIAGWGCWVRVAVLPSLLVGGLLCSLLGTLGQEI